MIRIFLAAALAVGASGCATMTRGSSETFTVETTPGGAQVALSLGQTCDATPCTFAKIKRDSEFSVTISKPGYKTTTHAVAHRTSSGGGAGMAGNVLVGGLIGVAIDANSGATQELVPNPLRVTMEMDAPAVTAAADATLTALPVAPAAVPPPQVAGAPAASGEPATPAAAPAVAAPVAP